MAGLVQRLLRLGRKTAPVQPQRCGGCTLAACATGCRAAVLQMGCDGEEAQRLRQLGLYEGACVKVVDSRNGMLLEVKGARLAVGKALASSIRVLPLGA
jgi:Fe2+ transport system protein FeoA